MENQWYGTDYKGNNTYCKIEGAEVIDPKKI